MSSRGGAVLVHEDVRRYLEAQHNVLVPKGGRYNRGKIQKLVTSHARKIAQDAMQGVFNGEPFPCKWDGPPFSIEKLASFLGHRVLKQKPPISEEAELHPQRDSPGLYDIYCNPEYPVSRQNFAIAHELGHTIIPPFDFRIRKRERIEKQDDKAYAFLEQLCNIAASELLLPYAPFLEHLEKYDDLNVDTWEDLSLEFGASREAVARRVVSLSRTPMAFMRLSYKLKPRERRALNQLRLFEDGPKEKLRVDYCCQSEDFESYFPPNKSVPEESPLIDVYSFGSSYSGVIDFDVRGPRRQFFVEACFALGGNDGGQVLALVWNCE